MQPGWLKQYFHQHVDGEACEDGKTESAETVSRRDFVKSSVVAGVATGMAAAGAVFAVLGLGAIDLLILLPIFMSVVGVLFGFFMAAVGLFIGGGAVMIAGPFAGFPGGVATAILGGIGLMAGATALGALTAIATILLVNATVWYARLHYRLLKPALGEQTPADGKF